MASSIIERVTDLFPEGSNELQSMDKLICKQVKGKTSQEKLRSGVVESIRNATESGSIKVNVTGKSHIFKLRFLISKVTLFGVNHIQVSKYITLKKRARSHTVLLHFPGNAVVCAVLYPFTTVALAVTSVATNNLATLILSPVIGLGIFAGLAGRITYKADIEQYSNPLFEQL